MSEYALNAKQDNLAYGILAGDLIKVRRQDTAEPGQLIVDMAGCVRLFEPGVRMLARVLEVSGPRG